MDEAAVTDYITKTFRDVETADTFGYTFFFYDGDRKLPFATLAGSDNEYDNVSKLDRPGVYRLNVGVGKTTFQSLFGEGPVALDSYDFTALDRIMPHPYYAAQHFICVLNPTDETWEKVKGFLTDAYEIAVRRNERRR